MFRIEAHIPLQNNEKIDYDIEIFNDLEILILQFSTGFSVHQEVGVWYGADGQIYREQNFCYYINMSDPTMAEILTMEIKTYLIEIMSQLEPFVLLYQMNGPIKLNYYSAPNGESLTTFPPVLITDYSHE